MNNSEENVRPYLFFLLLCEVKILTKNTNNPI